MGTNFYIDTNRGRHIGKRSAAGLYCWDCKTTLHMDGIKGVHSGRDLAWRKTCPFCGKAKTEQGLEQSTVGLELGFASPYKEKDRKGVTTVSSFTWAMSFIDLIKEFCESMEARKSFTIEDEYGSSYSFADFMKQVIQNCPIEFESIGEEFS